MIPIEIRILQFLKLEKEQREKEVADLQTDIEKISILKRTERNIARDKLLIEINLLTSISNWIIETFSQPTNTDNINLLRSDNK